MHTYLFTYLKDQKEKDKEITRKELEELEIIKKNELEELERRLNFVAIKNRFLGRPNSVENEICQGK